MAGEKAKENKKLVGICAGCGKELSVELLTGVVQGSGRKRRIVPLCRPCLEQGSIADQAKPAGAAQSAEPQTEGSDAAAPDAG